MMGKKPKKTAKRKFHPQTLIENKRKNDILHNLLCKASIILILKPNKDVTRIKKLQLISLTDTDETY